MPPPATALFGPRSDPTRLAEIGSSRGIARPSSPRTGRTTICRGSRGCFRPFEEVRRRGKGIAVGRQRRGKPPALRIVKRGLIKERGRPGPSSTNQGTVSTTKTCGIGRVHLDLNRQPAGGRFRQVRVSWQYRPSSRRLPCLVRAFPSLP